MSALTVEYKRLHSFGDYENEQVGITVLVGPDETAEKALGRAKQFVESSIGERVATRGDLADIRDQIYQYRQEQRQLLQNIENLRERRDRAVELLKAHGVNTEQLEEIPF